MVKIGQRREKERGSTCVCVCVCVGGHGDKGIVELGGNLRREIKTQTHTHFGELC